MEIIHGHLHHWNELLPCATLSVDRHTLAKRRWRGVASDGVEFGFDLERPLADGDVFFQNASARYRIEQRAETILEIPIQSPEHAATLGWNIGNLHFQIAVVPEAVHAPDDPAIRQMLDRAGIVYTVATHVFRPLGGGHVHGHHSH